MVVVSGLEKNFLLRHNFILKCQKLFVYLQREKKRA